MKHDLRINGVIINSQRSANSARTLRDRSNRVKVGIINLKEHSAIEFRCDGLLACGGRRIPQFKLTAKIRTPVFVQIDQHNQAALQATIVVCVPIGMDIKPATLRHDR